MLRQHVVYDTTEGEGAFLSNRHHTDMTAYGMHVDFFEAWNTDRPNRLIVECNRDGSGCGRAGRWCRRGEARPTVRPDGSVPASAEGATTPEGPKGGRAARAAQEGTGAGA